VEAKLILPDSIAAAPGHAAKGGGLDHVAMPPEDATASNVAEAVERSPDACYLLRPLRDAGGAIIDFRCDYANARGQREAVAFRMPQRGQTLSKLPRRSDDISTDPLQTYLGVFDTGRTHEATFSAGDDASAPIWISRQIVRITDALWVVERDITNSVRRERGLSADAERYRVFALAASDWFWEVDSENKFSFFSADRGDILGHPPGYFLGKPSGDLFRPRLPPERLAALRNTIAERRPFRDVEFEARAVGGERRYVRVSGDPMFNETGAYIGYRGASRDVTAIFTAEVKARQAEETLADAVETITVGFILYGPDRRLLAYNRRLVEMFPESGEELRSGKATFDSLQRVHLTSVNYGLTEAEVESSLATRSKDFTNPRASFEYQLPDGRWVLVNERKTRAGGLVGIRTDITEIRRRERALSVLLDHPAGDKDSFALAARALAAALGYRFAGVGLISADGARVELQAFWSGDRFADAISYPLPRSPCGDVCSLNRLCFFPNSVAERFPNAHLLRELGAVSYIGDVFYDQSGKAVGHVFAINDAADVDSAEKRAIVRLIAGWVGLEGQRRQAEVSMLKAKEQAEQANLTKSLFLANMGHELRTPLNAVIGFSQMLAAGYVGSLNERQTEYVRDIEASGAHLLQLINDLLDLSKAEAGRLELNESVFALARTFDSVTRLVREQAETAGVILDVKPPDAGLLLSGDELKIKQIMLNLLSNALKFTPSGGSIALDALIEADGALTVQVRDTGFGIASEDIDKAFRIFVQLESPLPRNLPGTGLGLPLSRALAELHGGSLTLQSEPGTGTVATLWLPAGRVSVTH
jgi:PAS domain S-box-containing protein